MRRTKSFLSGNENEELEHSDHAETKFQHLREKIIKNKASVMNLRRGTMPWHFHGIQHQENITKQGMSIVPIISRQ